MACALEMNQVCKSRGGRLLVDDFCLSLEFGQVLCLLGPSGVGKTTILEMAAGLLNPDAGSIRGQRQGLAYTFQDDALVPWLSAQANLELVLGARLAWPQACQRARQWLERLGLGPAAGKKPSELSGGMRRRLGIARSLAVEPRLLLMDEPFAFLDQAWQEELAGFIQQAAGAQGAAVLLVSHQRQPLRLLGCPVRELKANGG